MDLNRSFDRPAGAGPDRPAALDVPPALTPVLDLAVECGPIEEVGDIGRGVRRVIPILGGTFAGLGEHAGAISGEVLPGGSDWSLQRTDGVMEVAARYLLRTHDGAVLTVANSGILRLDAAGLIAHTVAHIEVGADAHRWLADSVLLGHLVTRTPFTGVDIRLYRVG